jgi:hypothetical protein
MKSHPNYFNIGPRLKLMFVVLVGLILAGNGLLVWQFQMAGAQTERLTGGNQQVIAVLRLQEELLSFHQRLDEVIQSRDAHRLVTEAEPLRKLSLSRFNKRGTRSLICHPKPE